jgi:predicted CoA-binding protein
MDQAKSIDQILEQYKTIAVVGLSSNEERPGYYVPAYLQSAGYRIIPVNPFLDQALGEQAYPELSSIKDPIDVVQIFRRPDEVPAIVDQAIAIGAKAIWMQLGITHKEAADKAHKAGLKVVMDACMMVEHRRRYS